MEKSLSPHYLLTIHYWTRYTRFRIPIAKSFPRPGIYTSPSTPYRLPYPILSQTNKRPVHGHDTDLHSRSSIRIRALIRILRNKPVAEGNGRRAFLRSSRVCLENKNASSKLVCTQCRHSSLLPFTLNPRPIRVFFFPCFETLFSLSFSLSPPDAVFFIPCYFLDDISPIAPPSNIVACTDSAAASRTRAPIHLLPFSFSLILLLYFLSFLSFSHPPMLFSLLYFSPPPRIFGPRSTDVAESSIFSPGLDSDIEAGYTHVCTYVYVYVYIAHWYSASSSHRITFLSSGARNFFEGCRSISIFPNNLSLENNTINN